MPGSAAKASELTLLRPISWTMSISPAAVSLSTWRGARLTRTPSQVNCGIELESGASLSSTKAWYRSMTRSLPERLAAR